MGEEVVGPAVLVEPAHQVGDGGFDVAAGHDGGVQEQAAQATGDYLGQRRGHALEHLDLEPVADSSGPRPR